MPATGTGDTAGDATGHATGDLRQRRATAMGAAAQVAARMQGMSPLAILGPPDGSQVDNVLRRLLPLVAADTGALTDDQRDAFLQHRLDLTWLLTKLPAQRPDQLHAKLFILCHSLRHELDTGCIPIPVTDYLLAASACDDAARLG